MYIDKCYRLINEETEAHTGQVTCAKTKAYHIYALNRQLPRVRCLQFTPQS